MDFLCRLLTLLTFLYPAALVYNRLRVRREERDPGFSNAARQADQEGLRFKTRSQP